MTAKERGALLFAPRNVRALPSAPRRSRRDPPVRFDSVPVSQTSRRAPPSPRSRTEQCSRPPRGDDGNLQVPSGTFRYLLLVCDSSRNWACARGTCPLPPISGFFQFLFSLVQTEKGAELSGGPVCWDLPVYTLQCWSKLSARRFEEVCPSLRGGIKRYPVRQERWRRGLLEDGHSVVEIWAGSLTLGCPILSKGGFSSASMHA